jgi:hypothetical protein
VNLLNELIKYGISASLMGLVFFSVFTPRVYATNTYVVNLMVAYDEEWISTAWSVYGYSAQTLAAIVVEEAFWYFEESFAITYRIVAWRSWDSDDSLTDPFARLDEAVLETGFVSGMYVNYYHVHVLVAFTDQDMPSAYGIRDSTRKAVLVEETYVDGVGQATDNVLQHELSHLYGAAPTQDKHHFEPYLMCVMNMYGYYIGFPYSYCEVFLVTNNWCEDCVEIINSNRATLGEPLIGGGGGGGGPGPYPCPYSNSMRG